MKDPCIGYKLEYPRCRSICPLGVRWQMHLAEERERVKAERNKDRAATNFACEQIDIKRAEKRR